MTYKTAEAITVLMMRDTQVLGPGYRVLSYYLIEKGIAGLLIADNKVPTVDTTREQRQAMRDQGIYDISSDSEDEFVKQFIEAMKEIKQRV